MRNEGVLHRVNGERSILQTIKMEGRKANWIGHILRTNCLMKHVTEGKIQRGIKVTGKCREDVSSYWMNLRKQEDTGNCMRKH